MGHFMDGLRSAADSVNNTVKKVATNVKAGWDSGYKETDSTGESSSDGGIKNKHYTNEEKSYTYKRLEGDDGDDVEGTMAHRSLFNEYSLVNYIGGVISGSRKPILSDYNKIPAASLSNPTVSKIVEDTKSLTAYSYKYADFAMCKNYNKIPNNYLITLRRYPFPVPDDIISPPSEKPQPDLARAVSWMGPSTGNELNSIMSFGIGYNWEEKTANVQTLQSQKGKKSGVVGQLIESSDIAMAATSSASNETGVERKIRRANAGVDVFSETYPNHVFGPLNVIDNVLVRKRGLKFEQSFTLKFEYEMRSFAGANPKILMLDQLANILVLTSNQAPFWGGSVRYIGDGSSSKPLGDLSKLKNGDVKGFLETVVGDLGGAAKKMMDTDGGIKGFIGKAAKNLLGGGLADLFNSPQGGQIAHSLLTGDPTGQWHLTVGNPLNPMMMMGNLACTDTKITFSGPMGPMDFPEKMEVEITLKPGRPRDKADIENMFNCGRGRFYLQQKDAAVDTNLTTNINAYGKFSNQ